MIKKNSMFSVPLFVRVLMVMAFMSITLTGVIEYVSDQTSRKIAEDGVRAMALKVTELAAENIGGMVHFKKAAEIEGTLASLSKIEGENFVAMLVVDAEGSVLASENHAGAPELELAMALVTEAMRLGEEVRSEDGFLVAEPVRFGANRDVVGGMATLWTPVPFLHTLDGDRKRQAMIAGALLLVSLLAAAFFLRLSFTRPLKAVISRTELLAAGDLVSQVPGVTMGSEIGEAARAVETLRTTLEQNERARLEAEMVSAGFNACASAMLMADRDLRITHYNPAFSSLAEAHLDNIRSRLPNFDPNALIGCNVDVFHRNPAATRARLASVSFPHLANVQVGSSVLSLTINAVRDAQNEVTGYVVEWRDEMEQRRTSAILHALETAQLRADFGDSGRLTEMNGAFAQTFGLQPRATHDVRIHEAFTLETGDSLGSQLTDTRATVDRFSVTINGARRLLDGSLSPTTDASGKVNGHVFLGRDITEAVANLAAAAARNESMAAGQKKVVDALRKGLQGLSGGNLSTRITEVLDPEYEGLRADFNSAVEALDSAIQTIVDSAATILAESGNISGAADDLSRRTEQQAATLEETAAAISQLTASVASAAEGAKQANDVVNAARGMRISRNVGGDFTRSRARVSRHRGQPFRDRGQGWPTFAWSQA